MSLMEQAKRLSLKDKYSEEPRKEENKVVKIVKKLLKKKNAK